jgi:hypothetical protein
MKWRDNVGVSCSPNEHLSITACTQNRYLHPGFPRRYVLHSSVERRQVSSTGLFGIANIFRQAFTHAYSLLSLIPV